MRKEEKSGKRRGAALCCLCFFLAALCLGVCASLAYAKYVSSVAHDAPVGVDGLHVTSTITYTDAGKESAEAIGGSLGAMKSGSDGTISMTLKVTNESAFAVSCHVTISEGFQFTGTIAGGSLDGTGKLVFSDEIAAGDTGEVSFSVKADEDYWAKNPFDSDSYDSSEAVFRYMELTVNYEQAG